jgi:hypothetical protein
MKFSQKNILCLVLLLTFSFAQAQHPTNWNTDLTLYASELEKRHIDLYNKIPKTDFLNELEAIKQRAQTQSDFKTYIDLMKLTRRIGDGHTAVSLRNFNLKKYPIELQFIENEWRVVKIIEKHANLFKTKLVAIDGVSIEKVTEFVGKVAQFVENKYSKITRTQSYLTIATLLHELGLTKHKEKATFRFLDDNGTKIEVVLQAEDMNSITNFVEIAPSVPQIEKPQQPSFDFLWYTPIKETNAVYVRFDSYPSFENMQKFGEELIMYLAINNTKNLVIDLRQNGGGDLYIGVILAYALNLADSIDWKHGVYILTSHVTFSAGTSNTSLLQQLLNGKIVGQPTGSNPSGYQDMDSFELPNSKLVITYSKRHFKLSETVTEGIQPDVTIYPTWKDVKENIDTELTWIVNDLKTRAKE